MRGIWRPGSGAPFRWLHTFPDSSRYRHARHQRHRGFGKCKENQSIHSRHHPFCGGTNENGCRSHENGSGRFPRQPFEEQELELAIQNVLEKQKLKEEVKTLKRQLDSYVDAGNILSTNPKVLRIKEIAKQVAD